MTNEELVTRIQAGEKDLIGQLYEQNKGLIAKLATVYHGREDPDDLKQEGYFGLVTAVNLWDPGAGVPFGTYAAIWIKQVMRRYIDNCGSSIRFPSSRRQRIAQYARAVNRFRVTLGRNPTARELMESLGIDAARLRTLQADAAALRLRSLNEIIYHNDDGDITLEDTLQDPEDRLEAVLDEVQADELTKILWGAVDQLKKQQADVLRLRYGSNATLKECADKLGVSAERIRMIEKDALRSLKRSRKAKELHAYILEDYAYNQGLQKKNSAMYDGNSVTEKAAIKLSALRARYDQIERCL